MILAGELALLRDIADVLRVRPIRTISRFAEDEIVLPTGPFHHQRFRLSRNPVARLLFVELESGRWRRVFVTGPNQDGKTLLGFVIVVMYILFELREPVILGVPSLNVVNDKWKVDLRPVIKASRYAEYLPKTGAGSKDGESVLFEFGNGASLRFMTAGGDDQSRASFTSPNVVVTETDGFDKVGGSSREGDKFSQLERRTLAFTDASRLIAECTVSFEKGRTWREIKEGSDSRIALKCPRCGEWVTPERDNFTGWQEAKTESEACRRAVIRCPECGQPWTNAERIEANHNALLVHKGQQVVDDHVAGGLPDTPTLGFRWNVVNSVMNPGRLARVGGIEWKAQRDPDEETAVRDVLQSQWATPARPPKEDVHALDYQRIMQRVLPKHPRGMLPDDTEWVTVGVDCQKRLLYWVVIAWRPNATPHVPIYGTVEVPCEVMSQEAALKAALHDLFKDEIEPGWPLLSGGRRYQTFSFVDEGNWTSTVRESCIELGIPGVYSVKGFGVLQRRTGQAKRDTGTKVLQVGENYNLLQSARGEQFIEVNVDKWKSFLHSRVTTPLGKPGAFTFYDPSVSPFSTPDRRSVVMPGNPAEHLSFAKHLCAEKQVMDFDAREGTVIRWEAISRNNHDLDASMLASVAGHAAGVRLLQAPPPADEQQHGSNSFDQQGGSPDGTNWATAHEGVH